MYLISKKEDIMINKKLDKIELTESITKEDVNKLKSWINKAYTLGYKDFNPVVFSEQEAIDLGKASYLFLEAYRLGVMSLRVDVLGEDKKTVIGKYEGFKGIPSKEYDIIKGEYVDVDGNNTISVFNIEQDKEKEEISKEDIWGSLEKLVKKG